MFELVIKYVQNLLKEYTWRKFCKILMPALVLGITCFVANSCKDSYGVDSNVRKSEVYGDTINIDTMYINFKKVIITDIVKSDSVWHDTVYVDTKEPLSYGVISNFNIKFDYLINPGQSQKHGELNLNNFSYLRDTTLYALIDYNGYFPTLDLTFSSYINYNTQTTFLAEADTLTRIDFILKKINLFDLASSNLMKYFQNGSKADLWFKTRDSVDTKYPGPENHFQINIFSYQPTGSGKISVLYLGFSGEFAILKDNLSITYTGFFNIVFI